MRSKASPLGLLVLAAALFALAVAASPAKAAFGIERWEALTCSENADTPPLGETIVGPPPLAQAPGQCTNETEAKWFTQAAGHPVWGITDFTLNTLPPGTGEGFPEGFVKDIVVDLPEGLGVNPEAAPKCTVEQVETNPIAECPTAIVGTNYFTVSASPAGPACEPPGPPGCLQARVAVPVFNVVPFDGAPSMVAFPTTTGTTFIVGSLDPVDQHVIFTISDVHAPPAGPPVVGSRLVFSGAGGTFGDGTYLTMPSNCAGGQTSILNVDQHADPGNFDEASFTTAVGGDGCELVPFEPTIDVTVDSATDSPEPATVDVQLPFDAKEPIANSHLLTAKVTLPEGAGLNPSVANGLAACTDAQFAKGTNDPIACPAASEIGTTEVQTPSLPPDSLDGKVYVGQPLSDDPSSGNQFRIFIHVMSERFGVNVRLVGNVFPNLQTGQLTAVVDNNPQAPFTSFKVHIDGGPTGALTTPDTCGPHTTTATFTPWSKTADVTEQSKFTLTEAPGGGPCPATLAGRAFNPGYAAGTRQSKAGAFSPFDFELDRADGEQELRQVDVNLPPGMVARLRGLEYCPEGNIAAAEAATGKSATANPPCPDKSFLGTSTIHAGSGPAPFEALGNVYLAGPYKGAPVSMVFATPAVAGPFDLGNVVVRVALNIDPETAEIHAVSDTIPYIFGGVKLDIRSIDVSLHRPHFTVNPTTCRRPFQIRSDIFGGGANPNDPAAWFKSMQASRVQTTNCRSLRFKPKFYARIFGGKNQMKRTRNPKFRAILDARKGDANVRRAAFILPRATILDQSHIRTICTRVQLAASNCPKASIYGHARATSSLLDGRLKGPVYLTSSDNVLPDLLADLRGQVNIRLRGVISSAHRRLKTVFEKTPDVAVDKFILTMKGGNRGLLVNSRNLCSGQTTGFLNLRAQNSRLMKTNNLRLNIPACRK
ncbi:MAG: hypothetical protein FVQ78_07010 [Solirubrobacterales bacterium]|nr:hypothetical protein [Solirubrobacterales bacterium]